MGSGKSLIWRLLLQKNPEIGNLVLEAFDLIQNEKKRIEIVRENVLNAMQSKKILVIENADQFFSDSNTWNFLIQGDKKNSHFLNGVYNPAKYNNAEKVNLFSFPPLWFLLQTIFMIKR